MTPLFPFERDVFRLEMGTRALLPDQIIVTDPALRDHEVALKRALLAARPAVYFHGPPATEAAQWDALALLLPNMARHEPARFALDRSGDIWQWDNRATGERWRWRFGEPASLPTAPLDWLGRQIQEDLLLLADDPAAGFPLIAGQLCFPNAWSLAEKLGRSVLAIHAPVPEFAERLGRSTVGLLTRLKPDRPVWRLNWAIKPTDRLDLLPEADEEVRAAAATVTAANAGARCFLRVERQVLARAPRSGTIVFALHTTVTPLARIAADPAQAARLAAVLRSTPPATLRYKGITPFVAPVLDYLAERAR